MRSKKITAVIVIAIVAITTLNVNIMLEDSAIDTFLTLNLSEKLALGEDTGSGASGEKGPMESTRVHCTSTTTTTTTTTNNNSNSSGSNVNGSVNAGWGPIGGSVSGGWCSNNSSGSSSSTTTSTETTRDYWADKILCRGASGNCTSYDPC